MWLAADHGRVQGKFANANMARRRLCGANDTQSTGIDRLRQEVMR
jgi:hypothetical protein